MQPFIFFSLLDWSARCWRQSVLLWCGGAGTHIRATRLSWLSLSRMRTRSRSLCALGVAVHVAGLSDRRSNVERERHNDENTSFLFFSLLLEFK